ncbi:helix-turn-helix domain-containing protein [Leifsonia sp. ZF2019]|uniref:helix-turn-helix transcriptional regulator n=1 Tax=Leifsonia sp. ZF2019 TaxID=2781978 RepID=UPI001CBC406F|nr:helix-turn-helix domain-containing protein [Leifsonia sp. ZF2019]UAJ80132.1 helix-turn-helix domain-containing protein [Leifsonia sp. ZF2019]
MQTARITGPRSLGTILREARLTRGLTQQKLSEELGVSKRYIIEMEQGKPTKAVERLFDYLRATGVTLQGEIADEVDL